MSDENEVAVETSEEARQEAVEAPIKAVKIPHDNFINLDTLDFGLDNINIF